jgi:hypothetical protein
MSHLPCNCNPPAVLSNISGERCHVTDDRGEWCAIVNESGVYLQTLIAPTANELIKEQAHQEKIQAEQVAESVKESRRQELKNKLDSGETLTSLEIMELLKLAL